MLFFPELLAYYDITMVSREKFITNREIKMSINPLILPFVVLLRFDERFDLFDIIT